MKIHGYSGTKTYRCWCKMRERCRDKHNPHYGGRGITVDPRWESFENFLADMGEKPQGMTLDRIDRNDNYTPGNCRWASWSAQNNNRSINQAVTLDGRTQTLTQWACEVGLPPALVFTRVYAGWTVQRALGTPADAVKAKGGYQRGRLITVGDRTQSLGDWAKETGVAPVTIWTRINEYGWSEEEAVTTPRFGRR